MSNYISDLNTYISANAARGAGNQPSTRQMNDKFEMNMQDFLVLMVTELQNQSLDPPRQILRKCSTRWL